MKRFVTLAIAALAALSGCQAPSSAQSSEREWARAECRNIIDKDSQKKCLDRVDDDYGRGRH
jgi:hypothetical protein